MCTLVSLIILHALEQKSLSYRCDTFSFSHSCRQPKRRTTHDSSQHHLLHGAAGSQHRVGRRWKIPSPSTQGQNSDQCYWWEQGMSLDTKRRWESQRKEKKSPCISIQAAREALLQKHCCYVDQIFPVLSTQFFQRDGDFLLKRGFS